MMIREYAHQLTVLSEKLAYERERVTQTIVSHAGFLLDKKSHEGNGLTKELRAFDDAIEKRIVELQEFCSRPVYPVLALDQLIKKAVENVREGV